MLELDGPSRGSRECGLRGGGTGENLLDVDANDELLESIRARFSGSRLAIVAVLVVVVVVLPAAALSQSSAIETNSQSAPSHNLSSLVIFEAIFLNPIDVPEMRLKRIPFKESLGSLHTSISHWTSESVYGSP